MSGDEPSASELLASRSWYKHGNHQGTTVWRHARTALTPEYPRWVHEGSRCEQPDCNGRNYPYKLDKYDTGVDVPEDYWEQGVDAPSADAHAGEFICDICGAMGVIALEEVVRSRDDVPAAVNHPNVIPLFGERRRTKT